MKTQKTDELSAVIAEHLSGKEIYKAKNDKVGYFADKILSRIRGHYNDETECFRENFYLFEREGVALKQLFRKDKYFHLIRGETIPLLLSVFIKINSPLDEVRLEKVIEEIQKFVYLENEEFASMVPFLKFAMLYKLVAVENVDIKEIIEGIRLADEIDTEKLIEKCSASEKILYTDRLYREMEKKTKSYYRHKLLLLSRYIGKSEWETAEELKEVSGNRHIGFALLRNKFFKAKKERLRRLYILALFLLPTLTSLLVGSISNVFAGILCWLPFYGVLKIILNRVFLSFTESEYVVGMELDDSLTENESTVTTISLLLDSSVDFRRLKLHLSEEYTKAPKGEMYFLLLCDLPESRRKEVEEDKEIVEKAANLIRELNNELENKFNLIVRRRSYSDTMKCYIGRNRKRGAVIEACGYIRGEKTRFYKTVGDISALCGCKYMILLDSDTETTLGSSKRLISAALHPCNRPVVENGKIISGYGIITPSIELSPERTGKNIFSLIYSHSEGLSHYSNVKSDIAYDLFGNANFCGKGIINIAAFYEVTKDFFKDEEVLSHDILEGIVLKTAYASDAVLLEGFPKSFTGYLKRNDRWIRGDFQNILFLHSFIKNRFYEKIPNPFAVNDRLRILENCIRVLQPVALILLFLFSFISYGSASKIMFLAGSFALFFLPVYTLIGGGGVKEFFRHIALSIAETAFLPISAYRNIVSAVTGAYRVLFSKRNMLQWQTAENGDKEIAKITNLCAPSLFTGIFFIISWRWYIRLLGILFLLSPVFCVLFKKNLTARETKPTKEERYYLTKEAKSIWKFFNCYVTAKDNFLPPDNVSGKIAHRTSPTNIGLYLISIYGAFLMDFISEDEMLCRIDKTLITIEKMIKYRGHLYNWYDTETLEIAGNKYISSVDSGNFICSLIALKNAVNDGDIKSRITKIIDETDFSFLYDNQKQLFYIGTDTEKLFGNYDMLMSESRMTGYMAIARGIVSKEHWSALQRPFSKCGLFKGPASWSGTAFEYFMPVLFMPVFKKTFMHRALRFSYFCQRKKAFSSGVPIGISESGFYAFDRSGNYHYKAHGVATLGLKRGLDKENVVSPYSTFLMMQTYFKPMYKNFLRLKSLNATGEYGLYEAIDYTAERIGSEKYKVVESYMAHHMGMSFLSIVNILKDFAIQQSFMKDLEMFSARELLYEKVLKGSIAVSGSKEIEAEEDEEREVVTKYIKNPFSS